MIEDKPALEAIAARLRSERLSRRLTQAEVARKAGVSENHYAQIERAEKNPTVTTFLNILRAIGVASKEILGL